MTSEHWLYRFKTEEWLSAARHEWKLGKEALARRSFRTAITHARRAAGMAANAVLVLRADPEHAEALWGRSYVDHLNAMPRDANVPDAVQKAAQILMSTPPTAPTLVQLRPDHTSLDAAQTIITWCEQTVRAAEPPPN